MSWRGSISAGNSVALVWRCKLAYFKSLLRWSLHSETSYLYIGAADTGCQDRTSHYKQSYQPQRTSLVSTPHCTSSHLTQTCLWINLCHIQILLYAINELFVMALIIVWATIEKTSTDTNPHPTWRWTTPSHFLLLPFSSWFIFPLKPCWLCRQICTETTTRWGGRTATCRHRGCSALSAFISAVVGRHPAFPSTPTRPLWKQPEPSPVDGVRWIRQGVVLPACRLCPNLVFLIYANSEARGRWGQGSWIPPNELTPPFIISTSSYLYTTD